MREVVGRDAAQAPARPLPQFDEREKLGAVFEPAKAIAGYLVDSRAVGW